MRRPSYASGLPCLCALVVACLLVSGAQAQDPSAGLMPEEAASPAAPVRPVTPLVSSEVLARFGEGPADVIWHAEKGYRSEIERTWFDGEQALGARATQARIRALELGVENLEAAALALITSAADGDELGSAMLATRLAPDLPLAHMAEARAYWDLGEHGAALSSGWRGLAAIPRHVEGALWVAGSLLLIVGIVLSAGSMVFIAVVGMSVFHHATHDVGDWLSRSMPGFARAALLASVILLPVALGEGIVGLMLGLLAVGFVYAGSRTRMALGLATALLLLGAYPIMRFAGVALTAFDGDRVAVAVYSIVQGIESPRDLELLRRAAPDDFLAAHALAVYARRSGRNALAFERYMALLESRPRDAVLLANLGNLHFGAGETEAAIDAYERAAAVDDSATVMFNLSQAFARAFRMEEFEHAMAEAQALDSERVEVLSSTQNPELVADLPIPMREIRDRLLAGANGDALSSHWVRRIAPGQLGTHYAAMGGAFLFVALLGVWVGSRFEHSSLCGHCGRRVCTRCDGTVWSSEICDPCYHLFNRPEATDPSLRPVRIAQLRERESRVARYETLASLLIPGVGGLIARRPDLGIVGVLLFAFGVASVVWHRGVVPDPLAVGPAGALALLIGAVAAWLAYFLVVSNGLFIRRNS